VLIVRVVVAIVVAVRVVVVVVAVVVGGTVTVVAGRRAVVASTATTVVATAEQIRVILSKWQATVILQSLINRFEHPLDGDGLVGVKATGVVSSPDPSSSSSLFSISQDIPANPSAQSQK
jgi:hypothetical protein